MYDYQKIYQDQWEQLDHPEYFSHIITQNEEMFSIFKTIETIGRTSRPILVTGDCGVGKGLIAKTIHDVSGRKGNFITVNVAGLDDRMFSEILFGHVRDVFNGANRYQPGFISQARGGTIVLDEIGDLTPVSQSKLLWLIRDGSYLPGGKDRPLKTDARIIATTSKDLWALQRSNYFRQDLNEKLRTHHIHIPPLRERKEDIGLLAKYFIKESSRLLGIRPAGLSRAAMDLLTRYTFPGNVRELKIIMYDAVCRYKGHPLSVEDVKKYFVKGQWDRIDAINIDKGIVFGENLPTLKEVGRLLVEEALRRTNGNQSMAAMILGISQPALSKRLKNYNNEYH